MYEEFDRDLHCHDDFTANNWSHLHHTAQRFMNDLNLSTSHPRCHDRETYASEEFLVPTLDDLRLQSESESSTTEFILYEDQMTLGGKMYTIWCQVSPALLAMSELWFRLFAVILAPLAIVYLLSSELMVHVGPSTSTSSKLSERWTFKQERKQVVIIVIGLASSLVLLTDTMYVFSNNGRRYGATYFLSMIILTFKRSAGLRYHTKRFIYTLMLSITCLALYLIANSESKSSGIYDHPGIDIPSIQPGFYYAKSNILMNEIANIWPVHTRTYDKEHGATPYLPTGDSLTGIPFLVNKSEKITYERVWVRNDVDKEAVALDIKFPKNGVHSVENPVFLILHGLNGGSHEEYVQEFIGRRSAEGHTCIVMIARGLMDTPIIGMNVFHGARILDLDVSAKAVSNAIGPNQLLAGVGYSMGAIVLSNYVARSGKNCYLDSAMAISGGLDMREMLNFSRGARLWQPMLAQTLRDDFIVNKFDNRFRIRLSAEDHLKLMRSTSVSEIDMYAIVKYNGYDSLEHYYSEMSAMGDSELFRIKTNSSSSSGIENVGRIANVSIPFCVMHALDDPLTVWRTIGKNPNKLVNTGSGHIMMLLTKSGGHVGWPLGTYPRSDGWRFMNDAALNFALSVDTAKRKLRLTNEKE